MFQPTLMGDAEGVDTSAGRFDPYSSSWNDLVHPLADTASDCTARVFTHHLIHQGGLR